MLRAHTAALIGLLLTAEVAAAQDLVVIVNSANPVSTLDAKTVKAHFMRALVSWSNGEKVRPIDHTGEPARRAAFIGKVLGMSPADLERHWIERQYASADRPPTKAQDDAGVITLVKTFKGAIGFVSAESAAAAGPDVKVVLRVTN